MKLFNNYVVVEGYKGTDNDMICRDFQYKIGKKYQISDEPILCERGFHLCLHLKDVFDFYSPNGRNRFFKVKALVNKNDLVNYNSRYDNKLVAKEIEFVEEVGFEEMKEHLNLPKYVDSQEEYEEYIKLGSSDYFRKKLIEETKDIFDDDIKGVLYDNYGLKNKDRLIVGGHERVYARLKYLLETVDKQNVTDDTKLRIIFDVV